MSLTPETLGQPARRGAGFNPFRWMRRAVALGFALVQAALVGRILLDLGIIPEEGWWADPLIGWSDAAAAPVQGIGNGLSDLMGGSGAIFGMPAGEGFNPVMVVALVGWSVIEPLVMRVVRKLEAVAH